MNRFAKVSAYLATLLFLFTNSCTAVSSDSPPAAVAPKSAEVVHIDPRTANTGLIVLGVAFVLTLVAAGAIGFAAVIKGSPETKTLVSEAISDGFVLRLGTIFGIVSTAGVLALCGALNDGAIALLSGIAGYVLGGLKSKPNH